MLWIHKCYNIKWFINCQNNDEIIILMMKSLGTFIIIY